MKHIKGLSIPIANISFSGLLMKMTVLDYNRASTFSQCSITVLDMKCQSKCYKTLTAHCSPMDNNYIYLFSLADVIHNIC